MGGAFLSAPPTTHNTFWQLTWNLHITSHWETEQTERWTVTVRNPQTGLYDIDKWVSRLFACLTVFIVKKNILTVWRSDVFLLLVVVLDVSWADDDTVTVWEVLLWKMPQMSTTNFIWRINGANAVIINHRHWNFYWNYQIFKINILTLMWCGCTWTV